MFLQTCPMKMQRTTNLRYINDLILQSCIFFSWPWLHFLPYILSDGPSIRSMTKESLRECFPLLDISFPFIVIPFKLFYSCLAYSPSYIDFFFFLPFSTCIAIMDFIFFSLLLLVKIFMIMNRTRFWNKFKGTYSNISI